MERDGLDRVDYLGPAIQNSPELSRQITKIVGPSADPIWRRCERLLGRTILVVPPYRTRHSGTSDLRLRTGGQRENVGCSRPSGQRTSRFHSTEPSLFWSVVAIVDLHQAKFSGEFRDQFGRRSMFVVTHESSIPCLAQQLSQSLDLLMLCDNHGLDVVTMSSTFHQRRPQYGLGLFRRYTRSP